MYLKRRDPSTSVPTLHDIQNSMNRLFDEAFDDFLGSNRGRSIGWVPAVEIYETNQKLVLIAEVPGFEKNDITISLENNQLTFAGERIVTEQDRQYHRNERRFGKFERSFQLPGSFDGEKVQANLKNGLLTITVPKREEAKPKQIEVKIG
jgi:HSP20 family protein